MRFFKRKPKLTREIYRIDTEKLETIDDIKLVLKGLENNVLRMIIRDGQFGRYESFNKRGLLEKMRDARSDEY